jgi:serine/threonine protein kinase
MVEDGRGSDASFELAAQRPELLEPDVRVDDFRIERKLGSGGMGVVYLATQLSLDRLVALKVIGDALNRPDDIARFRREAQAVARLDHPDIASVYYVGQDRQLCYMAMEFVEGPSLRRVIDALAGDPSATIDGLTQTLGAGDDEPPEVRYDGPTAAMPPEADLDAPDPNWPVVPPRGRASSPEHIRRSVEIARDAALALAHAHERGVVHRDVKPGNLLLDRKGRVRLIDFGIARFHQDSTVTSAGQIVGTPTYMSPEQIIGRLEVDHRTDVYSLGLVLYELLTLARAVVAPTREGILRHVVTKSLPPVSSLNAAISPSLVAVVHKATAKDPDDRYQTAGAFAADLKNVLDGKPVQAPPYRFRLDLREIDAERPKAIIGVSFAFTLVAIIILFWTAMVCLLPPETRRILGYDGEIPSVLGPGLGVAFIIFSVAWAILSGRRWGRWAGMLGCLGSMAASIWILYGFLTHQPVAGSDLFFANPNPPVLFAVAAVSTLAVLASPQVGLWFHLARRIRTEQKLRKGR